MDPNKGQVYELDPAAELPEDHLLVPPALEEAARVAVVESGGVINPAGPGPLSQFLRDTRRAALKRKTTRRRNRRATRRLHQRQRRPR